MVRKTLVIGCLLLLCIAYVYYYARWSHLWLVCQKEPIYVTDKCSDDTLRVIMIGDSWAGIHSEMHMDSYLCFELKKYVSYPVVVLSKGKGGEKSRGIYHQLFQMNTDGTKPLILAGVNYCIVLAGINDAAANLGTKQFCAHYRMILDFLLAKNIRPVIIEIPDVDIWNVYYEKPWKDLLTDFLRSTMTGCRMYSFHEYREDLKAMLMEEHLIDRVVYVPMACWNEGGESISQNMFMTDRVHLNRRGYEKLDACIAKAIACDLKQSQDSTLVNQPVN